MADPVNESASLAPQPEQTPAPLARPRPDAQVPRHRFGIAYLALAVLVGTAGGLSVVLATNGGDNKEVVEPWSAWQPATTGTLGVREIARHVGVRYQLNNGQQLVSVVAGPMQIPLAQGPVPVSALLIGSGKAGSVQQRVEVEFPQAGVFFQLCGRTANCQIPGASTIRRGQLLFREVLELALYTYHYLPQADNIVTFLPPKPGVQQSDPRYRRAIYLPRQALVTALAAPLDRTLPPGKAPLSPRSLSAREGNAINGFVAGRLFHYDFQQAADNSVLVYLSPIEV